MKKHQLLLATILFSSFAANAAEVTPDRLINAAKEPQNWLMNHGTYDAQRYSTLEPKNRSWPLSDWLRLAQIHRHDK